MNTVTLHRVLKAPPMRVYRAFIEPDALAKWLPPHGFTCKVAALEDVYKRQPLPYRPEPAW